MTTSQEQDRILDILKESRLFRQFADNKLRRIVEQSKFLVFQKEESIIREGRENHHFFILISGSVSLYIGKDLASILSRKGDIFGEKSVITKKKTVLSVFAESRVEAISIPATGLLDSDDDELKSIIYKLFVDIMNDKLMLTTNRIRGFQATTEKLKEKQEKLVKSEIDLAEKETILQSILASMSDGVVVTSAEGLVIHVNDAFKTMVGCHALSAKVSHWPKIIGIFQEDQTTLYTPAELPMLKVFEGIESNSEEIFIKNSYKPEGIWLQASSRLLKIDDNSISDSLVVCHDYTKKKNEKLALIEAKKIAESTAKAKSDFLAVMSHELRTPLNSILGMTDLLLDTVLSEEQKELLVTQKASSEILYTMIRNILDYNALESGDLCIEKQPFSLQKVFDEISSCYSPVADKKNIIFNTRLDKDLPEFLTGGDEAVKQILRNLVDNAIKFTQEGTVSLSAKLEKSDQHPKARFIVKDSGVGIDNRLLSQIFNPFTQEDSTYTRNFGGTGIGLSLCNRLVELLGGKLEVESRFEEGTKFMFAIDLDETLSNKKESMNSINQEKPPIKIDSKFAKENPLCILVAEDNVLNQKLIKKILNKLGYEPVLVENGEEAVKAVKKEKFDVLFMDLQMPHVDGITATEMIKEQVEESNQPLIIALTANVSEVVREKCFSVGMIDYISKPIKIDLLAQVLQKYA